MLRHCVWLFSSPAIFVFAISASSLSLWWFRLLSTCCKAFQEFPLISVPCSAGWRITNTPCILTTQCLSIQAGVKYGIIRIEGILTVQWGRRTISLGLLIIIFFTLLALPHGRSSVRKTPLRCDRCPRTAGGRSEAWTPNQDEDQEWSTKFWGEANTFGHFSPVWNNWPRLRWLSYCFSSSSPILVRSLTLVVGVQNIGIL